MKRYKKYMDSVKAGPGLRRRLVELEAPEKRPVSWKRYGGMAAALVLVCALGGFGVWAARVNGLTPPIPFYPNGFQEAEVVEPDIAPVDPSDVQYGGEKILGGYDVTYGGGPSAMVSHYILPYIEYGDASGQATAADWDIPAGAVRRDLAEEEIITLMGGGDAVEQHLGWNEYRLTGWAAWYEDGSFWGAYINGEEMYYGGPANQFEFAVTAGALPPTCFGYPGSVTQEVRGLTVTADKADWEHTYSWYDGVRTDSIFDRRVSFMKENYGYRFEMRSGREEAAEETVSRLVARIADRGLNLASLGGTHDASCREESPAVPEDTAAMTRPYNPEAPAAESSSSTPGTFACGVCGASIPWEDLGTHVHSFGGDGEDYTCEVCGKSFPVESFHFHLLPNEDGSYTCSACGTTVQEGEKHYHGTQDDFMCTGVPVPPTPAPTGSEDVCGYPLDRPEGEQTDPAALDVPPELRLVCSEGAASVRSGSCEWTRNLENGLTETTIACGAHPLDFQKEPALTTSDEAAALHFDASPDSVTVTCWPDSALGDSSSASQSTQVHRWRRTGDGSWLKTPWSLSLKEGGWIYELDCRWEGRGRASYAFCLVKN